MSVYARTSMTEIPEKCEKCLLFHEEFLMCLALDRDLDFETEDFRYRITEIGRPDWCPLELVDSLFDEILDIFNVDKSSMVAERLALLWGISSESEE